jgi:hypothetical protein
LVTLLTGLPNDVGAYSFAFSPNGTLFATYGGELFTIDVNSGDATLVGQTPGGSLAFSSDGTLYSSNGGDLYTVNQSTGAASLVTTLAFDSGFGETGSPNQMSLAFDPADGTLYTLAEWAGVEQSWLGTIDIATGEVTPIGITGFVGPGGLAIEASPEPASGFLIPVGLFILVALRQSLAGRANPCDYEKLCALFPSPSSASRSQVSPPSRKRPPSPIPTP